MLETGLTFTKTELVTEKNSAAALGSGLLPVYATPAMILLIEAAAAELAAPHLEDGSTTVGTKLDVEHVAATPIGMEVSAVVTLTEIDRRRLVFEVEVTDKGGIIGKGRHERFIVASEKFMAKTQAKLEL
ncbi:MAG: thioesterase [Ruminococcaceae bacterium]|nr:thioesterase [Oscillospiraceae bacterium]